MKAPKIARALFSNYQMACPECGATKGVTLDSRQVNDGTEIRRRRICINRHRFSTRERIKEEFETAEIISGIYA